MVGHLGKDPESRSTPSSVPITSFSVATSRRNGGDEKPVWFRVTCWRKLADLTAQYLRKGRLALVDGDLDVSAWIDRDGNPQATLELSAVNVRLESLAAQAASRGTSRRKRAMPMPCA